MAAIALQAVCPAGHQPEVAGIAQLRVQAGKVGQPDAIVVGEVDQPAAPWACCQPADQQVGELAVVVEQRDGRPRGQPVGAVEERLVLDEPEGGVGMPVVVRGDAQAGCPEVAGVCCQGQVQVSGGGMPVEGGARCALSGWDAVRHRHGDVAGTPG